ncbi:MAG: VCBS repeat-containing protein [Lewinella sp.]|nr:VCBS repeat-containing protein [Lewinella sp.]
MRFITLTLGACLLMTSIHAQPIFSNASSGEGINHINGSGSPGSGVSFVDFNGDGLDDLTLATEGGQALQFYLNNNGINFQSMTPMVDDQSEVKQVLWVDYDNDGDKDLFLAVLDAPNRLYRNDGELSFTEVTESAGLPTDDHRTFGACFGDINRDGWLDLYYGERKMENGQPANRNRLLRNKADGTFTEWLTRLKKAHLPIFDDFGLQPFSDPVKRTMLHILEDRYEHAATIFSSQLPVAQ